MRIVDVTAPSFAARGSIIAVSVQTEGLGLLRVGGRRRFVYGARETTFAVVAAATLPVGDRTICLTVVDIPHAPALPRVDVTAPAPLELALVVAIGDIP
ncbi:MAG TPA: hypothetical protein VGO62_17935 [Myxococcota bacterium]|jgi:hypothetical protein